MTCEPKEGYVAVRRDPVTKEKFYNNHYLFVKKAGTDNELWLVCIRGNRAGEALRLSEINEDEWIIEELDAWDDKISVYYIDNSGPMDLDSLRDEIARRLYGGKGDEISPVIRAEQMTRGAYLRIAKLWKTVNDKLRENPECLIGDFYKRQAAQKLLDS